jgi:hypothetical protein
MPISPRPCPVDSWCSPVAKVIAWGVWQCNESGADA